MLKPVFTEKSLKMAKQGQYTFWVETNVTKGDIKNEVNTIFGVHVVSIKTIKKAGEKGRNARGRKFKRLAVKKAVVSLKDKEKIDIFSQEK